MLHRIVLLSSALAALCAGASEYTLDFTGASALDAEAPVLRRAEMAASVGTVPAVAVGDTLNLKLFGDVDFALKIVSAPPAGIAGQSLIAKDENGSASAIVKVTDKTARISVDDFTNRRQYTVRCKDGVATITERDTHHESGGECGTCGGSLGVMPARLGEEPSSDASKESDKSADSRVAARKLLGASSSFPLAEQKCIVDVLVAFDQGAKTWAEAQGEWDKLEDCAEAAVQRMNMVLQNSTLGDDYSYRLAGITVLDDTDTDVGSALGKSLDGLGGYARLRAEQAACGADVPVVFIDTGKSSGTRGVSYALMSTNETSIANWWDHAFASCHIASSFDEYTMTHEVGHCLGAGHSNYNWNNENFCNESGYKGVGTPQSCDFSAGYHFTDYTNGLYHTIMGYNDGADGRRYAPTPYFSSPNIIPPEHKVVIGTSTNDNVRVLRHTCTYVANWRNPVKPGQYDVLAFDDQSREILDGRIFTGTLPVSLSSNIDGATIYYTTDGSTPTPDSNTYSSPISITNTTTLTVSAVTNGVAASVRSFKVFKVDSPVIANDSSIAWRTSSTHPWLYTSVTDWTGSDKQVIRGGLTGNKRGETFLKAEVEGPKQLSFRVKSKFHYSKSKVPAQYASQYTHCNFFVDEKAVVTMVEPQSDWIVVKTDIPEGTHTLLFSFIQQAAPNGASDGMWLDDMRLDDSASVSIVPPSSDWDGKTLPETAVTANVNSEYYSFYAAGNFEDPLNPFVQSLNDRTAVVGQVQTTSNAKCVYGISTGTESSAKTFSGDVYALVNGGRLDVASPTMEDYGSNFSYTSGDALLQLGGNCAVTYALGGNYGSGSRTIPGNVGITVKDYAQVGSIIGGWTMYTSSNGIQGNTSVLVLNNQTNNLTRTSGYKYVPEELTGYIIGASYADGGGYGSSTVSGSSSVRLAPTSSADTSCSKTIIGGGYGAGSVVGGNSSVTISGGAYSGNIYAGSYNGTVQGKATLTISGGTFAGAHLWGGNANGTKSLVFADNADLSDIAGISGFDSISILDGATVTVNSADILAVFTSRGYVTHDESAPYRVGIDICSWHDDNGTGTISSGWDYTPSSGSDAVMVLSQDTTLTIDAATTLGTVTLRTSSESPVTLTLEGSAKLTATSLNLPANITLVYNSNRLGIGKITGEGVVLCDGFKPSAYIGWSDDAEWHGTVWIKNISGGTSGNKGPAWDFNPDSFGNSNSVVRLTGVAGHFPQAQIVIKPAIELVDESDVVALHVNNGYSYSASTQAATAYVYAKINRLIGAGTIKTSNSGDNVVINVIDAKDFCGNVNVENKGLYFGEGVPAQTEEKPDVKGTIVINDGCEVVIASNRTWSAANGITVDGTLVAHGSISSTASEKIKGNGVVLYEGVAPATGEGMWTNSLWKGTVWVKDIKDFTAASFTPNLYGNTNSTLRLTSCSGYVTVGGNAKTEINVPFEFVDEGGNPALTINNGSSNPANETSFAEVKGSGTLACNGSADKVLLRFKKWDGFTGALTLTNKEVVFGDATISTVAAGSLVVSPGAEVSIPVGKTWIVKSGVVVNGRLNVNGALASESSTPLDGGGTVRFNGVEALNTAASWTGTNVLADVTYSAPPISAPIPLANLGNAASTIVLQGVKGYIENTDNIKAVVLLRNSLTAGREYGLNIDNGYSARATVFPKLMGDGTLMESHGNSTANQRFVFSDAVEYTGSIVLSSGCVKRFIFGEDDATVGGGMIFVKSGAVAKIGDGKTWTAQGVIVSGTLASGGRATIKAPATIKNGAILRFDTDDALFVFDNGLTLDEGDCVKLAIPDDGELTGERTLIKWQGVTPEGDFSFDDTELSSIWQLDKASGALSVVNNIARLPVVDILVAYDKGAQAYVAEKNMTLEEFAQIQIGTMNEALVTNRLDAYYSYRLAGVCIVDATYRQINAISTELAEGVGPLIALRAQRELYGADTVTLLIDNVSEGTLGYGCPMTTTDAASCHDDAFSVCSIKAVHLGKQHTMLHENAHNMGCGHADNVQQCSPFEYGRGCYFSDPEEFGSSRHTIMAYGSDDDASWYFSTSEIYTDPYLYSETEEDYVTLGDEHHDNKRVLTETCQAVSQWRDYVKPFVEDVIATDDADNEIFSGRVFHESIRVSLSSQEDDATIFYTTDGTKPTSVSCVYSEPLSITEDTTLKVALQNGDTLSPVRTIELFQMDSIPDEGVWRTSVKYPWGQDGDGSIRSFNHTEYGYKCTTPLAVKVEGPRRLSFMQKSYFSTPDIDSNYSHIEIMLDDQIAYSTNYYDKVWRDGYVDIPEGEHEVQFVFSQRDAMNKPDGSFRKDNNIPEMDDAWWIKNIEFGDVPRVAFVNCTSESNDVEWGLPYVYEANELEGNLGGIEIGTKFGAKGIVETLGFGSTNAVVLSVLAELPQGGKGEIAGCHIYRASKDENFYAFAYSNGDGTISLGCDTTTNYVTSSSILNWTGLHVWTFAFAAQTGAKLYCDGVEIASTGGIKWSDTVITNIVTFCDDPRGDWALTGAKVYAVHSDFGVGGGVFDAVSSSVDKVLSLLDCLSEYADESQATKLALLRIYKDTGSVVGDAASECVLRISEIMPKPTDDRTLNGREGMDVNGLESGWVEVENTSDQWADLKDYKFIRTNRSKANSKGDYGNFPSYLVPPYSRAIFYTSERYSNSASMKDSAWATADPNGAKPKLYGEALGNVLVWPDKVNPKKSPFVRLIHTPSGVLADTVVVPSDVPEGYSIIVGEVKESLATERWLCPTPTRGKANAKTDGLTRIGPNVGPLYENKTVDKKGKEVVGAKHDSANEFARVAPPAKSSEAYEITFSFNPVMSPTEAAGFRDEDEISSITLVYRAGLTGAENEVAVDMDTDNFDPVDWGHTYKAEIPADKLPGAGQLVQWKFRATDASGNEWTSPSFNNKDDGYEWYGTIVEPGELNSSTLPTWHMFVDNASKAQMDYDKDDSRYTLPNGARVAIYDSSTSNYYDYVRIDLRGHTSASFTKKGHGLRFAKAHPLTMRDCVTGEEIEEIRKTSLISEFADPSFMRQMIAFWLWRKMGNLVPFDFPVRCNLNGEFYQLAFNSERFTDELIEDVYGLDKFGYGYKNVGTLKSGSGTTAGGIEKKTPDDEDEGNVTVLQSELRSKITAAQNVSGTSSAALSSSTTDATGLENAELTKFVVQKFDLPAWLNYLASAKITQEMDDVWANICIYYDNPDMLDGARGTGTWMPLGYDFNVSFGQYYQGDIGSKIGLMSNQDWFKSHPFYGGNRVRCWKQAGMTQLCNEGNNGFEAVWQSAKFRRLYLRRLRTLMDQELKGPDTPESEVPFMVKMREMANLMRADSELDLAKWPDDGSDNAIDVWPSEKRPKDMDAGITEIWNDYVVPRRQHLYVTHSVTNTAKAIGYGSNLNAGIPEAQSPISVLAQNFVLAKLSDCVVISNLNNEVVDMSGWTLKFGVEWTLPAGTVCDSNDCIYVVADRRAFIETHNEDLTDQIIVGNAKFGKLDEVSLDYGVKGISTDDDTVVFKAGTEEKIEEIIKGMSPQLTADDELAKLDVNCLMVVAEPIDGKEGEYKAVVAVNPETVNAPVIAEPAAESEPVEIEEDDKGETTVSVSISNAVKGLWYGYEVSDELGESAVFDNDVDSFERATGSAHTITGSPRTEPSGFFRVKVLPAKPKSSN